MPCSAFLSLLSSNLWAWPSFLAVCSRFTGFGPKHWKPKRRLSFDPSLLQDQSPSVAFVVADFTCSSCLSILN
ncbi:hypothetical protein BKA61DRAFT_339194 [Leptodontidium sp. MPI-SDFR-AT-0119]|nr:hypothetical protein BKA61DRAFT_339194 [Leptodontidium sp. MPI-SDFR-AT-0119]